MSSTNTDAYDLASAAVGGLINEDVMQRIFNIDPVDLAFQDRVGRDEVSNQYKEWIQDSLASPNITNAIIDGADAGANNNTVGNRLGNYCQISEKVVRVSDRARSVDTIGTADELVYGLMQRQKELKRDMEAIITLADQAAVVPTDIAAGKLASLGTWLTTNSYRGATGADGSLSGTTGGYPNVAPTAGDGRGITETLIRTAVRACYNAGGNPTVLMTTPDLIETIANYLFTSSARVAALQSQVPQTERSGATAMGAVNIFVTNFGSLELVPNRFIQSYQSGDTSPVPVVPCYILDLDYWSVGYLQGIEAKPLARTGSAENRHMTVDYTLCSKAEKASAGIFDIIATTPMVA